jgi:hypothetical protein
MHACLRVEMGILLVAHITARLMSATANEVCCVAFVTDCTTEAERVFYSIPSCSNGADSKGFSHRGRP